MYVMEGVCGIYNVFVNKCGYLNGNIIISFIFKYREREIFVFRGVVGKIFRLMKKVCIELYLLF